MKKKHKNLFRTVRGFSLIELMIAVSISIVISSVILANHTRFNSSVLLGSLAYDIALSIREAQVYGLSVRQFSSTFDVGYGVRFSEAGSYVFFVDQNENEVYDDGVDTVISLYELSRGHAIQRFCGVTTEGAEHCSDSSSPITYLDIVFLRPEPDALMSSSQASNYSHAIITIVSGAGETREIEIASTGQISVDNP